MPGRIDARLEKLGISLPEPAAPAGSYVPFVVTGNLVVLSGQITLEDGKLVHVGKLGDDIDIETGYAAARVCAINLLAQLRIACGGALDRVKRVVRLGGFVHATPDFKDHPKVINGASDLMKDVFGDAGQHARAAVGCVSLPLGVSVEVEGMFEID